MLDRKDMYTADKSEKWYYRRWQLRRWGRRGRREEYGKSDYCDEGTGKPTGEGNAVYVYSEASEINVKR